MLKVRLLAENKTPQEDLVLGENYWRPARSLMAIANQKYLEKNGQPVVPFGHLEDIDENLGHGLDATSCRLLAEEMEKVLGDPFGLVDYGMTVDIEDGNVFYTYPTDMCTGYFEGVDDKHFYASLEDDDIVGKRVRSWFRTPEETMKEVICFLKVCGGFSMP